jgi:hypothetical protein
MSMIQYRVPILGSGSAAGPDGDAYTYISPKGVCRHMTISECAPPGYVGGAIDQQGLNYKLGSEGFANIYGLEPGDKIDLVDQVEEGNAGGRVLGHPQIGKPGMVNYNPATVILKIASATVTATYVLVKEFS